MIDTANIQVQTWDLEVNKPNGFGDNKNNPQT